MKNSTSEPPGARQVKIERRSNVLSLSKKQSVQPQTALRSFRCVEEMVRDLRPDAPVHCLRPATIGNMAKRFIKTFPGDVMYAVKCNPDPKVLSTLARAGIKHFDAASLVEVKLVSDLVPDAEIYFMHPVKSRAAIAGAYFGHGVRNFSLDCQEELGKILEVTNDAKDLNLFIRLSISNEGAAYKLAGKYGVPLDQAASLILAARDKANKLGVCFHVGSQCMEPEAYTSAMGMVADLMRATGVRIDVLDIGGGFPSVYPGMTPPPLADYMKAIRKGLRDFPLPEGCKVVCEPGRALVAEGGSTLVRVDLRKGNMLYINDGTYGSLFDAGVPAFVFPVKAIRPGEALSPEVAEFGFYGPTCDSMDTMKGPFHLPVDIQEGDWIEIGQLGSYGATMATRFNGFFAQETVEVHDKPLLSMQGVN